MNHRRDILLTGFPSFVARRLLLVILEEEPESFVRLLVRPDYVDEADRQLEAMGADRGRVQVLAGDVVSMDLGLSGTEYLDVIEHVTDIYHVASIWWLGVDREASELVNVVGTRNIIDAAYEMKHLNRLNHFSTAFVAGDRAGVIMEDELDEGQRFRNAYEETKFRSELAMREAGRHLPVSIFRPSIIVGDSQTGETQKFDGPYYLLRTISRAVRMRTPIPQFGRADAPFNVVPVDFVVDAIAAVSRDPDAVGETLHLVDPEPLTASELTCLLSREYAGKDPSVRLPARLVAESLPTESGVEAWRSFPFVFALRNGLRRGRAPVAGLWTSTVFPVGFPFVSLVRIRSPVRPSRSVSS